MKSPSNIRDLIRQQLVSEFEERLFDAALQNLDDIDSPLRFNNFAYAIREFIRHILKRLAPDESVLNCTWYKNETDKPKGISRRQRVYYAVQGGLENHYVKELGLDVDTIYTPIRDAMEILHKFTHIEESSFTSELTDKTPTESNVLLAINLLFTAINECKSTLAEALIEHLDKSVVDATLNETILEIDELATHHFINEVYTDTVQVESINANEINFIAEGSIDCELQWGSNSDQKNGDGAILAQTFPFTCRLSSPVNDPKDILPIENSLWVDTSSWHDNYLDEEQ